MSHIAVCPLLIPVSEFQYSGFIKILGTSYRVNIMLPQGDHQKTSVDCEWNLQHRIKHKVDIISQRLENSPDITSFLKDFIMICESCLKPTSREQSDWSDPLEMLQQIQDLGWEKAHNISSDLSRLELVVSDNAGRQHKLRVLLNKQDLSTSPVCSADLPEKFNFHWSGKAGLRHLYRQFESAVAMYQQFWNMLKEIDENCWILEPEHPTFAANHRRIAIGPNISLHIVVNCRQPNSLPECRLLGAESAVAELQEKLNINLHRWDMERSLLRNLEEVLDIDFPTPTNTNKEDLSVDCGICYCHNLNDEIPDIVCEEKRCAQAFHRTCLYEWLRSLTSRQSFNTLFGDCPLCSHPIRVKMPST